jgi:hypothetical protein
VENLLLVLLYFETEELSTLLSTVVPGTSIPGTRRGSGTHKCSVCSVRRITRNGKSTNGSTGASPNSHIMLASWVGFTYNRPKKLVHEFVEAPVLVIATVAFLTRSQPGTVAAQSVAEQGTLPLLELLLMLQVLVARVLLRETDLWASNVSLGRFGEEPSRILMFR